MYNPNKINELLSESGISKKQLLDYIGKNWNGSLKNVINGDIRVSKLEKIADFFGVPVDTFFDREPGTCGVHIRGAQNNVHHFSVHSNTQALQQLIEEKDKRIHVLEEMIEMLKVGNSTK